MDLQEQQSAHAHCNNNKAELGRSVVAGCFYCLETYSPSIVAEWIDSNSDTALCPRCGIDSVIGDASGLPVNERAFLSEMHTHWFDRPAEPVSREEQSGRVQNT